MSINRNGPRDNPIISTAIRLSRIWLVRFVALEAVESGCRLVAGECFRYGHGSGARSFGERKCSGECLPVKCASDGLGVDWRSRIDIVCVVYELVL